MYKGDYLVFLISFKIFWREEGWGTPVPGIQTSISFGVSSSIWPRGFSSLSTSTLSSSTCSSGEPTGCHPATPRSLFFQVCSDRLCWAWPCSPWPPKPETFQSALLGSLLFLFCSFFFFIGQVLFSVFCAIAIILFPILKFAQGNFENTVYGKICLLDPLETDSIGIKHSIMSSQLEKRGNLVNWIPPSFLEICWKSWKSAENITKCLENSSSR